MFRARNTRNRRACLYIFNQMEGAELIVFDTETTGLDPKKDYIVELAAQKYKIQNRQLSLIEEIDIFIRPPFLMDEKVVSIHGISNEFLESRETEEMLFDEINKFFGERPLVIGHNIEFDTAMMTSLYQRNRSQFTPWAVLDTLEMARDVIYGKDVENYTLGYLAKLLGLDAGLTFHRAIDDVKATSRLLNYCYKEYQEKNDIPSNQKKKLYVNRFWFWKGYNKNQSGIYVDTNLGKLYYSTYSKEWKSSGIALEEYDIDAVEEQVIRTMGIPNSKELGKMTEKKFRDIKAQRKKEGVYL